MSLLCRLITIIVVIETVSRSQRLWLLERRDLNRRISMLERWRLLLSYNLLLLLWSDRNAWLKSFSFSSPLFDIWGTGRWCRCRRRSYSTIDGPNRFTGCGCNKSINLTKNTLYFILCLFVDLMFLIII